MPAIKIVSPTGVVLGTLARRMVSCAVAAVQKARSENRRSQDGLAMVLYFVVYVKIVSKEEETKMKVIFTPQKPSDKQAMNMRLTMWGAALLLCHHVYAQEGAIPKPAAGRIVRIEAFKSRYVDARKVDVWLPEGYTPTKQYAVLYMHDGNMLFDSATTWNKQEWGIDETVAKLRKERKMPATIVVGVWNGGPKRHFEYCPKKPLAALSEAERRQIVRASKRAVVDSSFFGKIESDQYLKFLVEELKPYMDSAYSTKKEASNTFVMGASMGGLISLYALCEYPSVFGGAGCMSTHWPLIDEVKDNPAPEAFAAYLRKHLPDPKTHRLYFDHGTVGLDALYPAPQRAIDAVLKAKGYGSKNSLSKEFVGDDHTERDWRRRLEIPLVFLMGR